MHSVLSINNTAKDLFFIIKMAYESGMIDSPTPFPHLSSVTFSSVLITSSKGALLLSDTFAFDHSK